jgi:hypothetical protein
MFKESKRSITAVLFAIMLFAMLPTTVSSNENIFVALSEMDIPEAVDADVFSQNKHISRLYDQETLDTIIFNNDDDTRTIYVFGEPVKFVAEDGTIKDKSSKLYSASSTVGYSEEYAYINLDNDIRTFFPKVLSNELGVTLTYESYVIELAPIAKNAASVSLHPNDKDAVIYNGVFGDYTSIQYTTLFSGFKEEIVLDKNVGNKFPFLLKTNGLLARIDDVNINLIDPATKNIVAVIDPIYVYDSFVGEAKNGAVHGTYDNKIELNLREDGNYELTVFVNPEFLSNSDTLYPVYVDPPITINPDTTGGIKMIQDLPFYNGSGVQNMTAGANTSAVVGYVGTLNGTVYGAGRELVRVSAVREHIKIKNIPANTITNAMLYLREVSGKSTSATIRAFNYSGASNWTESTLCRDVTWETVNNSNAVASATINNPNGSTVGFNITTSVRTWKSNLTAANRGLMFKNDNETSTTYYKSFYTTKGATKPYFSVNFDTKSYSTRIYFDSTYANLGGTGAQLVAAYNNATNEFDSTYGMLLTATAGTTTQSTTLNGSDCALADGLICNTTCGTLSNCNSNHHKGAARLNGLLTSSSIYTYRIVGHRVCMYSGTHTEVVGVGNKPGKNATTSSLSTPNLSRSIQHELSHNFGASSTGTGGHCDTVTPTEDCVVKSGGSSRFKINTWCSNCNQDIWNNR